MRSVNPQSMRRRYKNIAGLTCYIQLNSKQAKRPPHLLHCRRGRSTLKPLSLQLPLIPALNCFCLKVMSHAFLSSAGKYNDILLSYPIFAAGQDLWSLRLVIKKLLCLYWLMSFTRRECWCTPLPLGAPRPMIFYNKDIGVIIEILNL